MGKRDDIIKGVHPQFKRLIKGGAELEGLTLKEYTHDLISEPEFERMIKKKRGPSHAQHYFKI